MKMLITALLLLSGTLPSWSQSEKGALAARGGEELSIPAARTAPASRLRYNYDELMRMEKSALAGMVLALQNGGNCDGHDNDGNDDDDQDGYDRCQTYAADAAATGMVFSRVTHSGYDNDGTLKWQNGNVFLLRHDGYDNDRTIYWPNGQKLVLRRGGYDNDGTIYHSDGSTWLLRHNGYDNDGQLSGPMTESLRLDNGATLEVVKFGDSFEFTIKGRAFRTSFSISEKGDLGEIKECIR